MQQRARWASNGRQWAVDDRRAGPSRHFDRTGQSQAKRSVMRTTRLITAPLAAALTTAALAGPAVAVSADTHNQPHGSNAGTSQGSLSSGDAQPSVTTLPGPPTWPVNPQPIARPRAVVEASDSGLDWLSAGIGAAAALFAIALVGIAGLRRRITRPQSLTTH
jgi:hypothetical protein